MTTTARRKTERAVSKTTVNLPTALLDQAKKVAEEGGVTLRELIAAGLENEIALRRRQQEKPFELRDASFTGDGLRPEWAGHSMSEIVRMTYPLRRGGEPEGRG